MSPEEITKIKKECYSLILESNNKLKEIRKICKHEETETCMYSYRIGDYCPAEVCSYCGEFIRYLE